MQSLDSLLPEVDMMTSGGGQEIAIGDIDPNPDQPRRAFSEESIAQLAQEAWIMRERGSGTRLTFEQAMRCIKPGGTLSSLGVYSEDLKIPLSAFAAGLGDHKINTALCPGGKERMRRLMNVLASNRLDLGLLVTHQYKLDDIVAAYDLFAHQRDGVLKIAIKP